MQKTAEYKIGDKVYHVKELRVRQIIDFQKKISALETTNILVVVQSVLSEVSDLKQEDLLDFTFSEVEDLLKLILEVNKSFFTIPTSIGLERVANQIKNNLLESILADWTKSMQAQIK